jgi:ABC-type uncharacterized transport system substrate-binding protein
MEYQKIFAIPLGPAGGGGSNCLRQGALRLIGKLALLLPLLFFNTELHAAPTEILILKSGPEYVYADIVEAVTTNLKSSCKQQSDNCVLPPIKTFSLNGSGGAEAERLLSEPWRLIVTLGGKAAARTAEHNPSAPVLHTVLPRKTFEFIYHNKGIHKVSAIFIDQPLIRKLALVREAMPERKRIGILITEDKFADKEKMQRIASKFDLTIQFGVVENEQRIGSILREILERSDVLLALPDPAIFNQRTVKNILLSSYHNRVPVVGFSLAYVKAGTIAAVYSSPDEIGKHIGEWISHFLKHHGRTTPTRSFPKYFSISTNKSVADSLKIRLPAAEILQSELEERGL